MLMKQTGCSGDLCTLSVPDFSFRSGFKVAQVSNGYQITQVNDDSTWFNPNTIQAGTCTSGSSASVGQEIGGYWSAALFGIILPCVR
jgi:hypothetical protein